MDKDSEGWEEEKEGVWDLLVGVIREGCVKIPIGKSAHVR